MCDGGVRVRQRGSIRHRVIASVVCGLNLCFCFGRRRAGGQPIRPKNTNRPHQRPYLGPRRGPAAKSRRRIGEGYAAILAQQRWRRCSCRHAHRPAHSKAGRPHHRRRARQMPQRLRVDFHCGRRANRPRRDWAASTVSRQRSGAAQGSSSDVEREGEGLRRRHGHRGRLLSEDDEHGFVEDGDPRPQGIPGADPEIRSEVRSGAESHAKPAATALLLRKCGSASTRRKPAKDWGTRRGSRIASAPNSGP